MRATRQKTQQRHQALIVSGAMLLVAAGAAFATLIGGYWPSKQPTPVPISEDFRGAIVTGNLDGTGCSLQVFDNRKGRTARSQQPCDNSTYDSNGVPIPTGTIHRLDAISKSFRTP